MRRLHEFLEEDNGKFSEQRLLCAIIVLAFVVNWMVILFSFKQDYHPDYAIVGLIMGLMGIKAYQKKNEQTIDRSSYRKEDDSFMKDYNNSTETMG
jgi:hypothetical protein